MRNAGLPGRLVLGLGLLAACDNEVDGAIPFGGTTTQSPTGADVEPDGDAGDASSTTGDDANDAGETASGASDSGLGGSGSICGDGRITGDEQCDCGGGLCDTAGLGSTSCADLLDHPLAAGLLTGGELGCNPASCRFDISACTYCGDDEINGNETCEPNLEIASSCADVGAAPFGALGCDASCQTTTAACTDCGVFFGFDDLQNCTEGWSTGRTAGAAPAETWACGVPDPDYPLGPSEHTSGVWATNLTGPYSMHESGYVVSPPLDLTACTGEDVRFTLRHWFNFEGGPTHSDGGIVQVSPDGKTWNTIAPIDGALYVDGVTIRASYPPVRDAVGFDGASTDERQWVESAFDLSSFAGTSGAMVRLVFGSDESGNTAGWYIDHASVVGSGD